MVYDRNASAGRFLVLIWRIGAWLYAALGRIDEWYGATSWSDALSWLASHRPTEPLEEIQFWGHGEAGMARIGESELDVSMLHPTHRDHRALVGVRLRLKPETLWWFRTCSTYGSAEGHEFAHAFTDFLGCRTAGHTFIIGPLQSGLHSLSPGQKPGWPVDEGTREGKPAWSKLGAPNTITFLGGKVPKGY